VSVAAIRPEPSLDRADCVARLIPGQKAVSARHRKGPTAVHKDGTPRVQDVPTVSEPEVSHVARFLLPQPFAGDDPQDLWRALLMDYACVAVGWGSPALVRTLIAEGPVGPFVAGPRYVGAGLLFAIILTLLGYSEGLYRLRRLRGTPSIAILAKSIAWTTFLMSASFRLVGYAEPSTFWIAGSAMSTFATLVIGRLWRESDLRRTDADRSRNVLLIGSEDTTAQLTAHITQHPELRRTVRGFLDETSVQKQGLPKLGEELAKLARLEFVDEVILTAPFPRDLAQGVIREARRNHLDVKVVPDLYGCEIRRQRVEDLGIASLVTLHEEALPTGGLLLKRLLDLVVSGGALLALGPLMLVIAGLVKLDSTGPSLYSATRVGRKGRTFRCHKFRTMFVGAANIKEKLRQQNQREGPTFKMVGDPRITRVGRWLRRYSVDELPQLWNVFKGEMSLVGPRPHPLDDFARYELEHLRRLDVTPGITGLWQVTARRSPSFHINMALDLEYIEKWSLWADLRILLRTVAVVFQGTGA
jgi:exopolysaccharide biosynthesis polyprenyl glycosylphosphotransferase